MKGTHVETLKAPFPYFGGKSRCADVIWNRFGAVRNYVEPFFGSGAVLLRRPAPFDGYETVNDLDGMVSNFWRSLYEGEHEMPDSWECYAWKGTNGYANNNNNNRRKERLWFSPHCLKPEEGKSYS